MVGDGPTPLMSIIAFILWIAYGVGLWIVLTKIEKEVLGANDQWADEWHNLIDGAISAIDAGDADGLRDCVCEMREKHIREG